MVLGAHLDRTHRGVDRDFLHREGQRLDVELVARLCLQRLECLAQSPHAVHRVALDVQGILTCLDLEVLGEGRRLLAIGVGEERRQRVVPQRRIASVGNVARLVDPVGEKARLEPRIPGGLHEQQQVVRPVARDHRVGRRFLDLGDVGREILDLVHVVDHVSDDRIAVLLGVFARQLLHVMAPAVVLADDVDLAAERIGLLHGDQHRLEADLRIAVPAEVVEVALRAGELHGLGADVDPDDLLAGISRIVLLHVGRDLAADGRGGALDDDLCAIIDRGLELVGRFRRSTLIVVFEQLDPVRPCFFSLELEEAILHGRLEQLARYSLTSGQCLNQRDLDRLGVGGASHAAGYDSQGSGDCSPGHCFPSMFYFFCSHDAGSLSRMPLYQSHKPRQRAGPT